MSAETEPGKGQVPSPKELAFARLVVAGKGWTEAYRLVYTVAPTMDARNVSRKAAEVYRRKRVQDLIERLRQEVEREVVLERAEIIREIHALATSDIRGIVDGRGRLKLPHQLDPKTAAGISKFKMSVDGTIEYTMHSKVSALDQAAKILGLYERDNRQKTDPLKELLSKLGGKVLGVTQDNSPTGAADDEDD